MGLRDPRHPATFLALVLGTFVLARFLAVGVHEVLGHGLVAISLGGSFYGFYVSPVTGFALVFVPNASAAAHAAVAIAGILVDLLFGLLVLSLYPRFTTFVSRLLALTALETFLVYSLAYLTLGGWAIPGGDPEQVVAALGADHLVASFAVVGLVWAVVAGFLITRELIALVRPGPMVWNEIAYLVLFWFPPLPMSALPNLMGATPSSGAIVAFFTLTFTVIAAVVLAGYRLRRREAEPPAAPGATGRIATVAVAVALVLPAWAFFGSTGGTAQNLLLGDPPIEAERVWANPQALNLRVHVAANQDVSLEFWMKGVRIPDSPLEARVLASYEDRADLAYWSGLARVLAGGITNLTAWNVTGMRIDGTGTVWFNGQARENPRVVDLTVQDPVFQQSLRNITVAGGRTYMSVTVYDPFRANRLDCPECFLDEVNVTWPSSGAPPDPYRLIQFAAVGGTPERDSGFHPATGLAYVRFRNLAAVDAPLFYQVVLEVV